MLKFVCALLLLPASAATQFPDAAMAETDPVVVASIKPVHSLVAAVMAGGTKTCETSMEKLVTLCRLA